MTVRIVNFGMNVRFTPQHFASPRSEADLLRTVAEHGTSSVRCFGSRHAWSPLIPTNGLSLSLENFNQTTLVEVDGQKRIRVGAGCQIKRLIAFLNRHNLTLPTLGLIDEQTLAGATSTGTHGSGHHSLSHLVQAVRVAHFDPASSEWIVRWIRNDESFLPAARCSLGALGVITELELPVRPQYNIQEHIAHYTQLEDVLAAEDTYPQQQFFFIPWRWDFLAQHRKETNLTPSWSAPLYRLFWLLGMDTCLHLLIVALGRLLPWGSSKLAYRMLIRRIIPLGWKVVDRSDRQLTMQHEMFRHIEMELFVPKSKLADMLHVVRNHLERCAAKPTSRRYEQHYPICIRKVLPDDTWLSPASGGTEPWYAVSLISYNRVNARNGFLEFATDLAEHAADTFGARPHWGKICPLDAQRLRKLYPNWEQFLAAMDHYDAKGIFRTAWLNERLRR
ncbi:MAG: FAD-binding protein [Planctomycetales bacterium]|nr:FAD-binding protein [Planctomycetales bacterium]